MAAFKMGPPRARIQDPIEQLYETGSSPVRRISDGTAPWCLGHTAGREIEQIHFLLGHASDLTVERYFGWKQNLEEPVNERFGRLFRARSVELR